MASTTGSMQLCYHIFCYTIAGNTHIISLLMNSQSQVKHKRFGYGD